MTLKKLISATLIASFALVLPAHAGYYKTIYVEDDFQPQPVIVKEVVQAPNTVVIQETNYVPATYNPAIAAVGVSALVGGVILGSVLHDHHRGPRLAPHMPMPAPHHAGPRPHHGGRRR